MKYSAGLISQQLRSRIGQWLSEGSGWMIESVDKHYLNIIKYIPMEKGHLIFNYQKIKSPQESFINIKNEDKQCLRWCHIRQPTP